MKTQLQLAALALFLSTINSQLSTAFAQGSLAPPGAPAATMKTLDQVYARLDARTAITNAAAGLTISVPGSYYLTTNLTVSSGIAITITAKGVTLDLNGFTISSTAASATGVGIQLAGSPSDITIFNGHIRSGVTNDGSGNYSGSGFIMGISYSSSQPVNTRVSGVSVSGCLVYGIYLNIGDSTLVESCTVRTVGNSGISASIIKNSAAVDCGGSAIYGDQVSDCRGKSSGGGYGVFATAAQNCYGSSDDYIGVFTTTAQNCSGVSTSDTGLYAVRNANNCYGTSSSGTGLFAYNASFCTGNRTGGGGTAIQAIIATGCIAVAGTNLITYKYNMP